MSNIAVTITFDSEDNSRTTIVLDTVEDTSITGRSDIDEFPMVNGDIVADHTVKQPITMALSGTFALNGSNQIVVNNEGIRLASIEKLFESLQKDATICDIVKVTVAKEDEYNARFLHRENMVLQSYTWIEKVSSIDYSLSFRQIQFIEVDDEPKDVDPTDENLPDVTAPKTSNFTDTLFDVNQFNAEVLKLLNSAELITRPFLNYIMSLPKSSLIALGVGAAAALVASLVASGPAILVVAIAAVVAVSIGLMIKGIAKLIERSKYQIEAFKYYSNEKKRNNEVKRFCQLEEDLKAHLDQLNDALKVFKIPSDGAQECLLTINDKLYSFIFTKNNGGEKITYNLDVVETGPNGDEHLFNKNATTSALKGISECNKSNYIFTDETVDVYLIQVDEERQTNQGTIKLGPENLSTYYIFVSSINMEEYTNLLNEIILNQLKK